MDVWEEEQGNPLQCTLFMTLSNSFQWDYFYQWV